VFTHVMSNRKTRVHVQETQLSSLSLFLSSSPLFPLPILCLSNTTSPVRPLVSSPLVVLSALYFSVFRNTIEDTPLTHTPRYSLYRCLPKLFLPNSATCSMADDYERRCRRPVTVVLENDRSRVDLIDTYLRWLINVKYVNPFRDRFLLIGIISQHKENSLLRSYFCKLVQMLMENI